MIDIMDYESLKERRLCNSCRRENETENATNWCVECREPLCANCSKWHRRFNISENHKILSISEIDHCCFPSNPKCSKHPDRPIDAFCADHNVQCCLACVILDHRKCEDVGTVEEAAGKLRKSQRLETLEKDLSNIEGRLKELANEKKENIKELKITSIKIRAEVMSVRKRIDSHLDKIQERTLSNLLNIEQSIIPDLEMEKDEIERQQSVVSCGLTVLRFGQQYASDAQLLHEIAKIKDDKTKLEEYLHKTHSGQVRIQYQTSKEVLDIESVIVFFGRISTTQFGRNGIPKIDPLQGKAKKILEFRTSSGRCGFTGAVILPDDKIIVAQYNSKSLEMYSPNGNMISELYFDGNPWCVEMIGDESGVMTEFNNYTLVFFNIINDQLVETKRKSFRTACFDVRCHDNKLYMACNTEIMILDTEGRFVRNISPLSTEARFLDVSPSGESLWHSSNNYHTLTCINMDGRHKTIHIQI